MNDNFGTTAANLPSGFNVVTVKGVPLLQAYPGQVFWVNNSTTSLLSNQVGGSDTGPGTYSAPFATIQKGIDAATASRGDIVFVKAGHAETVAGSSTTSNILLNKAGVAIVGLGSGSNRPTLTFSAAASTIGLSAANMCVSNFLFLANFLNVTTAITVVAAATPTDFVLQNSEFRDSSTILDFVSCLVGNATANSMDGFAFDNNQIFGIAATPAAATTAVVMATAQNRQAYRDNYIVHAIALNTTAVLLAMGANDTRNVEIARNKVFRPTTDNAGGSLVSTTSTASSGYVYNNYSWHLDNSGGLLIPTGTLLATDQNFCMITGAADKSGLINPAAL